jgi:hypothetical protein
MDDAESREDIPRISIDTLRDWHRIKTNFSKAVLEQFDQAIRQSGLESERASLLSHVQQVPIDCSFQVCISSHIISVYRDNLRKGQTQCSNQWKEIRGPEG